MKFLTLFAAGAAAWLDQQPLSSSSSPSSSSTAYRSSLLDLHRNLIATSSLSGTEGNVGNWLVSYLEAHNYHTLRQALPARNNTDDAGRFNVLAWPAGDAPKDAASALANLPPLLVTSHIDVVPPHIPYSIDDGAVSSKTAIHGRGSVDAKGSVAAQITAVEVLRSEGLVGAGDVMLLFVVGEEDSGDGMKAFSAALQEQTSREFASAIFGEPTENKLACGHKGVLGCTVTATGRAGHSGYPWLGKSANDALVRGLVAVLDAAAAGELGATPVYGNTTVNVGLLQGGVAANVIPAAASATLAIRVARAPQQDGHAFVRTQIEKTLAGIDADALAVECSHGYGIVECACDVAGFDTITVNYGTDVPNLAGNHTRYLYGPGDILVAHSDHEALTVGDLETAVEGYKALIKHALGR